MKYTKTEAINAIQRNAKIYKDKLANTSLLIVYKDKMDNKIKSIEVMFLPTNFQHLTGIKLIDNNGIIREHTAKEFYNRSLYKPFLTEKEILFKNDGTTPLKLDALYSIMNITKITKIAGEYSDYRPNLKCDYVIGNTNACLCVTSMDDDLCYPTSALNEDIRNLVTYSSQVLFVMQTPFPSINEDIPMYNKIVSKAKNLNINEIILPNYILEKINPEIFKVDNKKYTIDELDKIVEKIENIRIKITLNNGLSGKDYVDLKDYTLQLTNICDYYKNTMKKDDDIIKAYSFFNNNTLKIRDFLVLDSNNNAELDKQITISQYIKEILINLKKCVNEQYITDDIIAKDTDDYDLDL